MNKAKDYFSRIMAIKNVMNHLNQEQENKVIKHLNKVCGKKKAIELSLKGSVMNYRSMFINTIEGAGDAQGVLIDTLMPLDGDKRIRPGTEISLKYNYGLSRYRFDTTVKKRVKVQFPAYYLDLPKEIISDDKRIEYRLPLMKSKPLLLDRSGDRILSNLLQKSQIKNFTEDGICVYIPPVTQIAEGLNFVGNLFSRFFLKLPDSTITNPIKASCRYIKPAFSSNGYICGLRFEDISHWDKIRMENMYDERKHQLRLA